MPLFRNSIAGNIVAPHEITNIAARHADFHDIDRVSCISYNIGRAKRRYREYPYFQKEEQQQEVLQIPLFGIFNPGTQNRNKHIDGNDHRKKPEMIPAAQHLLDGFLPFGSAQITHSAVIQAISSRPYPVYHQQPEYVMGIQPFHTDISIQENSAADHHKNRDTETEQRVPGIRNLPFPGCHREYIPFLAGTVQHNHTECSHDAKQIIMNHPFILRHCFHKPCSSCSSLRPVPYPAAPYITFHLPRLHAVCALHLRQFPLVRTLPFGRLHTVCALRFAHTSPSNTVTAGPVM